MGLVSISIAKYGVPARQNAGLRSCPSTRFVEAGQMATRFDRKTDLALKQMFHLAHVIQL